MASEPTPLVRRKLPGGLLGALWLVVMCEAAVTRRAFDTATTEEWQYLSTVRAAAAQARDCDLLVLGDSQLKLGVLPELVTERSGLRSYNLAVAGAQAPASYEVLRRAVAAGARPSAILVDFHQFLLAMPPQVHRHRFPFVLGFDTVCHLGWCTCDPAFLAELLARGTLPSLRCRRALRVAVLAAIGGTVSPFRSATSEAVAHWERNQGAWIMPPASESLNEGVAAQRLTYRPGWVPDGANAEYVRRFLRLATSTGAAVYWLMPPIHPALQASNEASGFDQRYVGFVRKVQQQFPGLVVLDARHSNYAPGAFANPDHLGRDGAVALSRDLGELFRQFRRRPPSSRWVALPRFRSLSADDRAIAARVDVYRGGAASAVSR